MGSLDDYLMERISPVMKNVEVLNLFDQRGLTEQVLVNLVKDCSSLRSLCLNGCMVTVPLLSEMLLNPKITNLSIVDALQLTNQELDWFAEELEQMGHKIKIYSSLDVARRNVVKQDEWFLDMELDIFKMWDRACKKSI
jgi:hypothetical protein